MVGTDTTVAVILARGGSKGIPRKNLRKILGVPLVAWTVRQCTLARLSQIYVSTDCEEIATIAQAEGACPITRPHEISDDFASSESGLLHAVDWLHLSNEAILLMPQVTSPLRVPQDIRATIDLVATGRFDSAFSASRIDDVCVWELSDPPRPLTYDPAGRSRRQDQLKKVVENGSLYCMRVGLLRETGLRLGGRIGVHVMPPWTLHEIDAMEDIRLCEVLMEAYLDSGEIQKEEA